MTGDKLSGGVRINRYEQGVNRADIESAADLARVLNVPLAFLFSETDDQAELLLAFAQLPLEDQKKVLRTAQRLLKTKPQDRDSEAR